MYHPFASIQNYQHTLVYLWRRNMRAPIVPIVDESLNWLFELPFQMRVVIATLLHEPLVPDNKCYSSRNKQT